MQALSADFKCISVHSPSDRKISTRQPTASFSLTLAQVWTLTFTSILLCWKHFFQMSNIFWKQAVASFKKKINQLIIIFSSWHIIDFHCNTKDKRSPFRKLHPTLTRETQAISSDTVPEAALCNYSELLSSYPSTFEVYSLTKPRGSSLGMFLSNEKPSPRWYEYKGSFTLSSRKQIWTMSEYVSYRWNKEKYPINKLTDGLGKLNISSIPGVDNTNY